MIKNEECSKKNPLNPSIWTSVEKLNTENNTIFQQIAKSRVINISISYQSILSNTQLPPQEHHYLRLGYLALRFVDLLGHQHED